MKELKINARLNADNSVTVEISKVTDEKRTTVITRVRTEEDIPREYSILIGSVIDELR